MVNSFLSLVYLRWAAAGSWPCTSQPFLCAWGLRRHRDEEGANREEVTLSCGTYLSEGIGGASVSVCTLNKANIDFDHVPPLVLNWRPSGKRRGSKSPVISTRCTKFFPTHSWRTTRGTRSSRHGTCLWLGIRSIGWVYIRMGILGAFSRVLCYRLLNDIGQMGQKFLKIDAFHAAVSKYSWFR